MIEVDYNKLHRDLLIKMNRLGLSQRQFEQKKIISRTTLFRINKKKPINLECFFKAVSWLENGLSKKGSYEDSYIDVNKYLIITPKRI